MSLYDIYKKKKNTTCLLIVAKSANYAALLYLLAI